MFGDGSGFKIQARDFYSDRNELKVGSIAQLMGCSLYVPNTGKISITISSSTIVMCKNLAFIDHNKPLANNTAAWSTLKELVITQDTIDTTLADLISTNKQGSCLATLVQITDDSIKAKCQSVGCDANIEESSLQRATSSIETVYICTHGHENSDYSCFFQGSTLLQCPSTNAMVKRHFREFPFQKFCFNSTHYFIIYFVMQSRSCAE